MKHDVFISYSTKNKDVVFSLRSILEENGISCWIAPDCIPPGMDYAECIVEAINDCSVFLLMLSDEAQKSQHVRNEIEMASSKKIFITFMLEYFQINKAFSYFLQSRHRMDAYRDMDKSIRLLIAHLYTVLKRDMPPQIHADSHPEALPSAPATAAAPVSAPAESPVTVVEPTTAKEAPAQAAPVPVTPPVIDTTLPEAPAFDQLPEHIWLFYDPATKKIGLVDTKGQILVKAEWDYLTPVQNTYLVEKNEKRGVMNTSYKLSVPIKYDRLHPIGNGRYAAKMKGKYGLIDQEGNILIPFDYTARLDQIKLPSGQECYATAKLVGSFLKKEKKYGVIDFAGREIVPFIYDELNPMDGDQPDLIFARMEDKSGFIDHLGRVIIPFEFEQAYSSYMTENRIAVKKNGRYGYIDAQGAMVIPAVWDYASEFRHGLAAVKLNDLTGFIDTEGHLVIPNTYQESILGFYCSNFAIVKQNGKYGAIDRSGKQLIPCVYESLKIHYSGKYLFTESEDLFGLFSSTGQQLIPCRYEEITYAANDLFYIKSHGLYGLCDAAGREMVPCHYEELRYQGIPLVLAKQNGLWGAVGLDGEMVIPFEWEGMGSFIECGVTWAIRKGRLCIIDCHGKILNP